MSRARNGTNVPDEERCRAMTTRNGERCPNRGRYGHLCKRHSLLGAIIPDGWTKPDNLPVWLYEVEPRKSLRSL